MLLLLTIEKTISFYVLHSIYIINDGIVENETQESPVICHILYNVIIEVKEGKLGGISLPIRVYCLNLIMIIMHKYTPF